MDWTSHIARYEQASPLLLAMDSPTAPQPDPNDDFDWVRLREHNEARIGMARSWRFSWIEHWALIAQYLSPRRSLWLSQGGVDQPVPNSMVRGLPVNQAILDPCATYALRVAAAGMMAGLMSPARPWFKLGPGISNFQLDRAGQLWYEEVEERAYTVMAESNFYDTAAMMFKDLVGYATSPVLIYEDPEDVLRCYCPMTGEYFLFVGSTFRPDGFARLYAQTVSQTVMQFGLDNCPPDVQQLWAQKGSSLDREIIVAHLIEPNFPIQQPGDTKPFGRLKGDFAYRETYWKWASASPRPMSIRGFHELPFIAPRWQVNGNDPYGSDSPGMVALGDIMQLQQETRRKAELLEKVVRPPLNAPVELKNQPSSILPGHVTYTQDTSKGMKPVFEVDAQGLPGITADLAEVRDRIKQGFFNDLFLMLAESTKDMTAFEVAQRQQEKLQVLGPVIERFQNEGAGPAIRRVLSIMERRKLLPPVPRSLRGVPMKIEYISLLALAQKAAATAGIERFAQVTMEVAKMRPEVLDIPNWDAMIREYGDQLSIGHKVVNDEGQVKKLRKIRDQQAQMMHAKDAAQNTLPALAGAAKDAGQIDLGGGITAANLMLGAANSGQAAAQ
jgi:hypothetical protein